MTRPFLLLLAAGLAMLPPSAYAATVRAAVAANFTAAAEDLAAAFNGRTGDEVIVSPGSTGALYAQIAQGAPFDVFLAADDEHAGQAIEEGLGVEGTAFPYAVGRLVLFAGPAGPEAGEATLRSGAFEHLAIADPQTAPYGAAAAQTIARLGLAEILAGKLVTGTNIAQTLAFVDSGNAELGFVALSQVIARTDGSQWLVPAGYHDPIVQGAVLLLAGRDNPAAIAFLDFLRSAEAEAIIARHGYAPGGS